MTQPANKLIPSNEEGRLNALKRYEILDTPPDGSFDRITSLASRLLNVPIAIVSLVDSDRIWFKSHHGLPGVEQIEREPGLCASAILSDDVYYISNAIEDPRSLANPLVAGEFGLRFYGAAPLKTMDGFKLGTLCVIDHNPRSLSKEDKETLEELAAIVMDEMELRLASRKAVRMQNELLATLTRRTEELAESNEELERFAYIASHDLKAPLRAIKLVSTWIEEDLGDKLVEESKESFHTLRSRIERMENMLDSLLEYSRVGQEDSEINETLSGDALMQDVLSLTPDSQSVTIDYSPAFADILVKRMPLQQIFLNLISNAIKHNDKEQGSVKINCEEEGNFHLFSVKDNGPGIAEEHREKIFEMFHKLKSRDEVEGSGIGLAIVQKAVKLHGGKITLTSEPGKGSTFTFSWPKLDKKQKP